MALEHIKGCAETGEPTLWPRSTCAVLFYNICTLNDAVHMSHWMGGQHGAKYREICKGVLHMIRATEAGCSTLICPQFMRSNALLVTSEKGYRKHFCLGKHNEIGA